MNCCDGPIPIPLILRSWGYSFFLHVVFWGVAGWVWSQEAAPPQRDVFQWDVALVQNLSVQTETPVLAQAQPVVRQVSGPVPASGADSVAAADESTTEESRMSVNPVEATPVIEDHPSMGSGVSQVVPFDREVLRGEPQELREDAAASIPGPVTAAVVSSDAISESQPSPAAIRSESVAAMTTGSAAVQGKPDFGWLMQTLWSRVAELKHYPHEARLNRWQGKVVVRAVIDEHGHLLEVTIATSSGHEALDRAAIEVIKRSCPLALPQPLGRSQIVLRVPIQYRLDQ